jgi:uncharacterized protein (TIGR02145 family)
MIQRFRFPIFAEFRLSILAGFAALALTFFACSSDNNAEPSSSSTDAEPSSSFTDNGDSSSSIETPKCGEAEYNPETHFCDIRDGKKYAYVDIGSQTWMAQNLNYSGESGTMGRCFKDDPDNCEAFGRLYTLDEMFCASGNCTELQWGVASPIDHSVNIACPVGWHLPSTTELEELLTYSDPNFVPGSEASGQGKNTAATKLKAISAGGTDDYGFSGLMSGFCGGGCTPGEEVWNYLYPRNLNEPFRSTFWWSHAYGAPVPLAKSWHISSVTGGQTNADRVDDAYQSYSTSRFYTRCLKDKDPITKTPEHAPPSIACSGTGTAGQKCHYGKWKDYFTDDRDGKEYPYVEINGKVWMAANLDFVAEDGSSLCYNDLDENCGSYGRLYNWRTAMDFSPDCNLGANGGGSGAACPTVTATSNHKGVCPEGWHLPADAEWTALTTAIGGINGTAAKLKAGSGWDIKNTDGTDGINGTDDYGFAALPGSYGNFSTGNVSDDNFRGVMEFASARGGFWWSTTRSAANGAQIRHLGPTLANINRVDNDVSRMYSVRCVLN